MLLTSFATFGLKSRFNGEFTLTQLHVKLSIGYELFDGILLSYVTRFLLSDGSHQGLQVHDLTLDPVSNMLEWILQLLAQGIQFVFQMSFGVTRDQLDVGILVLFPWLLVTLLIL